ncbi:hypothetical protein Bhyg_10817, partial [Pseudolycoriella hygida]
MPKNNNMTQGDEDLDVESVEEKLTFINGKLVPYDGANLQKKDKKTVETVRSI